jgi:hypothetical protein
MGQGKYVLSPAVERHTLVTDVDTTELPTYRSNWLKPCN